MGTAEAAFANHEMLMVGLGPLLEHIGEPCPFLSSVFVFSSLVFAVAFISNATTIHARGWLFLCHTVDVRGPSGLASASQPGRSHNARF